jgi:hypothetical protein
LRMSCGCLNFCTCFLKKLSEPKPLRHPGELKCGCMWTCTCGSSYKNYLP